MKTKKSIILIALLLSISLFTTACSNKIEEKIGGKIAEKAIEKATDGEVDVNVDSKDGVSIEMGEGSMEMGENLDWPKDSMGSLPEPKATIVSITELKEENSTSLILSFNKKDGGADYMDKLIDLGYIQTSIVKSEMGNIYTGVKDDNSVVMLSYQTDEEQGSLMYMRDNDIAKEHFAREDEEEDEELYKIDPETSMDWPEDSMDDIPELKAQITSVSRDQNRVSIGYESVREEDISEYVEKIKKLGFVLHSNEIIMNKVLSYSATNDEEYMINISWSKGEGSITYTKQ